METFLHQIVHVLIHRVGQTEYEDNDTHFALMSSQRTHMRVTDRQAYAKYKDVTTDNMCTQRLVVSHNSVKHQIISGMVTQETRPVLGVY